MAAGGFALSQAPGTWSRREEVGTGSAEIAVDLLVPEALGGTWPKKARGGRIPPHASTATRQVRGLEVAAVDNDWLAIRSLDHDASDRSRSARVAGIVALLVAKAHKIDDRLRDRVRQPGRLQDKDAGDVVRLMQLPGARRVADRFEQSLEDPGVGDVVRDGLTMLRSQFANSRATGTRMAVAALEGILGDLRPQAGPDRLRRRPRGPGQGRDQRRPARS